MDASSRPAPASTPPSDAAAETIPHYTHQQVLRVIAGILLCILLAALDQTVVVPAVPAIAADLNGFGHLSWIVTAYLLTSTAATPIYGRLSDMWGRRALLIPAIILFIVASALCALAGSLLQLIAARALQGVGGAGLMAMAQAAIADVVAPRERGRYQGFMAGTWGVASVAGPIVGGYMTEHLSWHWVFWINLPIGLVAMWLSHRGLAILPVRRARGRIDYLGAALLTAGVTAWLLVLSWGGVEYPWLSPEVLGMAALGLVLLALLVVQERRAPDALLPTRIFANGVFVRSVVIAFFTSLGLLGGVFLLPLFFQLVRGSTAGQSGLLVVPFLVSSTVGAFAGGQMARRIGRVKVLLLWALGGAGIGFALLGLLDARTPLVLATALMLLVGFAIGLSLPSVLVQAQNAAERRDVGVATGSLLFLRSMGSAFGSTVVGAVLLGTFERTMARLGRGGEVDLGGLRQGSDVLANLPPEVRDQAAAALAQGFHLAFWVCAAAMAVALLVAAGMRDVALRSGGPAEGGAIGH